jgi:hypothetical protein
VRGGRVEHGLREDQRAGLRGILQHLVVETARVVHAAVHHHKRMPRPLWRSRRIVPGIRQRSERGGHGVARDGAGAAHARMTRRFVRWRRRNEAHRAGPGAFIAGTCAVDGRQRISFAHGAQQIGAVPAGGAHRADAANVNAFVFMRSSFAAPAWRSCRQSRRNSSAHAQAGMAEFLHEVKAHGGIDPRARSGSRAAIGRAAP